MSSEYYSLFGLGVYFSTFGLLLYVTCRTIIILVKFMSGTLQSDR